MNLYDFIKKEWPMLLILLAPFIIISFYWNDFPAQIPIHWNFSGEIDDYSTKEVGLFLLPGMNIIMYVLFFILPKIDPRKGNYKLFQTSYNVLRFSLISFMFILFVLIVLSSLGNEMNIGLIVINLSLMLIMIIGNFLGKIKSNFFVGIKTPWTLENPENWTKTHRFGAKVWVWSALLMIILGIILPMYIMTVLYFIFIGIIVILPMAYSFILHKKLNNRSNSLNIN